jgi:hypothetical protein
MDDLVIDDIAAGDGDAWALVTDGVMGGLSRGRLERREVAGRPALRLTGAVSLANNGGFIQMARDWPGIDAQGWAGLALDAAGNGESYGVHLRTTDLTRPWQSFRAGFTAGSGWQRLVLPFAAFTPHRTDMPLRLDRLRRIGLIAIGREMAADLALGRLALVRAAR